jgi:hypothetical protein
MGRIRRACEPKVPRGRVAQFTRKEEGKHGRHSARSSLVSIDSAAPFYIREGLDCLRANLFYLNQKEIEKEGKTERESARIGYIGDIPPEVVKIK